MTTTHDRLRADIAAWWAAHPDFREKYRRLGRTTADSLAKSTVHWHHNLESARRYGSGSGGNVESATYFLREYAKLATIAWLLEAQAQLEHRNEGSTVPSLNWYEARDLECHVYTLQRALDDFEHNNKTVRDERAKAKEAACAN